MQSQKLSESTDERAVQISRADRKRAERLDRTLSRSGFVRTHSVETTHAGVDASVTLPRYYLRQSLAPVLSARGFEYEITAHGDRPDPESLVVARIRDDIKSTTPDRS